jgi:hypothetical protein
VKREEYQSACYFIPTLKKDKGRLTFAGAFTEDVVAKTSLISDVLQYRQFLNTCIVRYRDEEKLDSSTLDEKVIERIIPAVELYNFAKQIVKCERESQVRELLAPKALSDYEAVVMFSRLVNLFVHEFKLKAGSKWFRKAVYLMIDELDDLLRASAKEAREVNDYLRHIYDSCPNCFGLVVALSADAAELPAVFEKYILDRIQRKVLFDLLDKEDAVEFVRQVMDANRANSKGKVGFFPFDRSAIDGIMSQLVEITPRKIVNVMQQVIEESRLQGLDPRAKVVSLAVLEEKGILEEVLGDGGLQ